MVKHSWEFTFLITNLIIWLFYHSTNSIQVRIPGCPGFDYTPPPGVQRPYYCYCEEETPGEIVISCLLGSNTDDVINAYKSVAKAEGVRRIKELYCSDSNFTKQIPNGFLADGPPIEKVTIRACEGKFLISEQAFHGQQDSIQYLSVSRCYLPNPIDENDIVHIPKTIQSLYKLSNLTFRGSNIQQLDDSTFKRFKNLHHLDITSNDLAKITPNAFKPLANTLETLDMSRNSLLSERNLKPVTVLKNLSQLKLNRFNLAFLEPRMFEGLQSLQTLSLVQNVFEEIPSETFMGLSNLVELNLRINLVNMTAPGSFKGLTNLKKLYLGANYIDEIDPAWFADVPNLEILEMSYNEMLEIPPNTFKNVPQLKKLDLKGNYDLQNITKESFSGLKSVETVLLSETKIENLTSKLFEYIPSVRFLDLSSTGILNISSTAFQGLSKLRQLFVNTTKLESILNGTFRPLKSLTVLDLSDNAWYCDANLTWLPTWLANRINAKTNPLTLLNWETTVCAEPVQLERYYLSSVEPQLFLPRGANYSEANFTLPPPDEEETTTEPSTTTAWKGYGVNVNAVVSDQGDDGSRTDHKSGKIIIALLGVLIIMTIVAITIVIILRIKDRKKEEKEEENATKKQQPSDSAPAVISNHAVDPVSLNRLAQEKPTSGTVLTIELDGKSS